MSLTVTSFFNHYMFHPQKLSQEQDRTIALISSIVLGIFTLGLAHLICYTTVYDKNWVVKEVTDEENKKTREIFLREVTPEVPKRSPREECKSETNNKDETKTHHDKKPHKKRKKSHSHRHKNETVNV